jgi:hypothetical protein
MSALGQKQTPRSEIAMSALLPKADIEKHRHLGDIGRNPPHKNGLAGCLS